MSEIVSLMPHPEPAPEAESDDWWTGLRDVAYLNLLAGATVTQVVEGLGLPRRTLYDWRCHPFWRARLAQDRQELLSRHEDALLGLDDKAVQALHQQLPLHPRTNLEYLHRRGILPKRTDNALLSPPTLLIEYKGDRQ